MCLPPATSAAFSKGYQMSERAKSYTVLTMNTLAFTVCFAVWMLNGVLITYLVDNVVFNWDKVQMGWLIGIPVLTGSLMRLPAGILTDKYGGRIVYTVLLLLAAPGMFYLSFANSFIDFVIASLWFGLAGTSFAIGIAYTSVWFKKGQQGTALGIFGAGNAGAALTSLGAPSLLGALTNNGANIEGWRQLPRIYGVALIVMAILFFVFTHTKKVEHGQEKTLVQRLAPLKKVRVWRFGLYYFLVFGGFVALAQWLVPYYVNVYTMSIVTAGLLASVFSLPSGVIRALGGVLSDKFGARSVMYWILGAIGLSSFLLFFPRMDRPQEVEKSQRLVTPRYGSATRATPIRSIHSCQGKSTIPKRYCCPSSNPGMNPSWRLVSRWKSDNCWPRALHTFTFRRMSGFSQVWSSSLALRWASGKQQCTSTFQSTSQPRSAWLAASSVW
jgi:NNP family nitrate/nitrite transporter-like MFS transporter